MEPEFFGEDVEDIFLRGYQSESIEELRRNIRNARKANVGHIAQVLSCATGAGKTIVGAYLLRECWQNLKSGIFVVDRTNLLDQTSVVFQKFGIPHGVLGGDHPRYRPSELIQVASIHTIAKRGWPNGELIVIDECHIRNATTAKKIERKDAEIIGLTATPFTRGMGKLYSSLVNVTTGNKLTKEGYLVPFQVWAAREPDMRGAKVVAGEWTDEEASKRAIRIVGDVVKEYRVHGGDRKSICFGVDVAHCEVMQSEFLAAGIKAELYTYRTSDEERDIILREYRKPDSSIRILISVAALSRGFDVPDVGCIIMCRPLKNSFAEFIQIIGRGLRSHPSKRDCYILDLAGNFNRHYPAMVEFFEEGAQTLDDGKPKPKAKPVPQEKKPRKCPKCKYLPVLGDACPSCGFIMRRISSVKHEAGELAGFDGAKAIKRDRGAKELLWAELRFIQIDRNYKRGWPYWKYQQICGTKPPFSRLEPQIPRRETLLAVDGFKRHQRPTGGHPGVKAGASRAILELDLFA